MNSIIKELPSAFVEYMGKDGIESIWNFYIYEADYIPAVEDMLGWRRYSSVEEACAKLGIDSEEVQSWDDLTEYFPVGDMMENGDYLVAVDTPWKG